MELKQLQCFVVSVDMGSLSRAAEALYTSQSHVSKMIISLEKELALTLLERTPSGVRVTEEGKKVYEHARRMLVSARSIVDVKQESKEKGLSVMAMSNAELADAFADYLNRETELTADYQEGRLEQVIHQVAHRQVDLGLVLASGYQEQTLRSSIRSKKLELRPIRELPLVVCVGPMNPFYGRESITMAELQRLRYVQNQQELAFVRQVGHLKDNLVDQLPLQIAATVESDHLVRRLVERSVHASIGCGLLSAPLHALRIEEVSNTVVLACVYRAPLSEQAERFLAFLEQRFCE